jgi:hypothetical protein
MLEVEAMKKVLALSFNQHGPIMALLEYPADAGHLGAHHAGI